MDGRTSVAKETSDEVILSLNGITKTFTQGSKLMRNQQTNLAVNDVSLDINRGEVLSLVGESGCGKSTLGRVILRLHDPTSGEIVFDNENLTDLNQRQLRTKRKDIQMIFQDPFASLNPRMTVRDVLAKPFKVHGIPFTNDTIHEIMERVGLNPKYEDRYPHEFSGGQRQRIGIGRAIALNPKLIVCDEPVSALDVSVQAQILNLLKKLKREMNMTYIFISHDLSVVKHISDRIAVMYLGNIVEIQDKASFYEKPLHPYSEALLSSIPIANPFIQRNRERIILKGELPSPFNPPTGCPFHPRCGYATEKCKLEKPELNLKDNQYVACHYPLN